MVSLALTDLVMSPASLSASALIWKFNPQINNTLFFFPKHGFLLLKSNIHSVSSLRKTNATSTTTAASNNQQQQLEEEEEEEEENFQVLSAVRSKYNDIVIVDTPKSRMLFLDSTHNVHSILNKGLHKWTGSYWDEFASFPAIVPKGPIAIYGLGGGTAAHLMLDIWPSLLLEGWEIDEILINKARDYFELSDLEKHTQDGGILHVHIGDVFSPIDNVSGKCAGIIVDLFSKGKVLSRLEEVTTWLTLKDRLMPEGRFMVNCGGFGGATDLTYGTTQPKSMDDIWMQNSTIKALSKAFPGKVSWKRMAESNGENFLAITGPLPDLSSWSTIVPDHLSESVKKWKPCVCSLSP